MFFLNFQLDVCLFVFVNNSVIVFVWTHRNWYLFLHYIFFTTKLDSVQTKQPVRCFKRLHIPVSSGNTGKCTLRHFEYLSVSLSPPFCPTVRNTICQDTSSKEKYHSLFIAKTFTQKMYLWRLDRKQDREPPISAQDLTLDAWTTVGPK